MATLPTSSISTPPTQSEDSPLVDISLPNTKTDPYTIHPSDNPTTVFFSPVLQGDNYAAWSQGLSKALNAKGKLGFIDGSLPPPTDPIAFTCWKRCDDLVGSWLINSIHADIRPSCLFSDSAATLWNDLRVRFSQSNLSKIYQLKSAIATLKQDDLSVTVYFTRIKALWAELSSIEPSEPCICGASMSLLERHHRDRAMEFLQGLHDRFSAVRSQILLIEPLPLVDKIFNFVKQEESQQFINNSSLPSVEAAALQYQRHDLRPNRASSSSTLKRQRPFCDHCNRHGHTRATCYQLHGFPSQKNRGTHNDAAAAPPAAHAVTAANHTQPGHSPAAAMPSLSAEQYSRLLALLSSDDANNEPRVNNLSGPSIEDSDW